jgi:Meiotically up-regulated gene 113
MIYFIQNERTRLIKIGFSGDVYGRMRALQNETPDHLDLLAITNGDREEEIRFHKQFAVDRVTGEWFRPSDQLLAIIESFPKIHDASLSELGRKSVNVVLDHDVRFALRMWRAESGESVSDTVNRLVRQFLKSVEDPAPPTQSA